MPLDDTITPGQLGHISDHETIADRLNNVGTQRWPTLLPNLRSHHA